MQHKPAPGGGAEDPTHMTSNGVGLSQVVLEGLQKSRKELPCTFLYDEHGSQLLTRFASSMSIIPRARKSALCGVTSRRSRTV